MAVTINGTTGITTPDITSDSATIDTTTLVVDEANNRVGIGTTSPSGTLQLRATTPSLYITSDNNGTGYLYFGGVSTPARAAIYHDDADDSLAFRTAGAERMAITSGGNLQFNSGYGSVATAYGCRAWVNFNGTGTPAARGSGNISTISDEGTGQYGVNFTTAMPDANYNFVGATNGDNTNGAAVYKDNGISATTTNIRIRTKLLGNQNADRNEICVSFFR